MSAYIVSQNTIAYVLDTYHTHTARQFGEIQLYTQVETYHLNTFEDTENLAPHEHNYSTLGDIILQENIRSVQARYKDNEGADLQYHHRQWSACAQGNANIFQALKNIDCIHYQSCETDDYEQSASYHILEALKKLLLCAHPEYVAAKWGSSG